MRVSLKHVFVKLMFQFQATRCYTPLRSGGNFQLPKLLLLLPV